MRGTLRLLMSLLTLSLFFTSCMLQDPRSNRDGSQSLTGKSQGGGVSNLACSPEDGEAVVCGQLLAADGVTPVIGASVSMVKSDGFEVPLKNKKKPKKKYLFDRDDEIAESDDDDGSGVFDDDDDGDNGDCKTDSKGRFACKGIHNRGKKKIKFKKDKVCDKKVEVDVEVGKTREIPKERTKIKERENEGNWLVVPGKYDGVQALLSQLRGCKLNGNERFPETLRGSAECDDVGLNVLEDHEIAGRFSSVSHLRSYDFIFINCPVDMSPYASVLQDYVNQGGHVYYSDWASAGLQASFPNNVDFGIKDETNFGKVQGHVHNSGLKEFVGDNFNIVFDLSAWVPIDGVAGHVKTYVKANTFDLGGRHEAPISVGWKENSGGCIFFTSYHIEAASTGARQEMVLKYLLLNLDSVCGNDRESIAML